MAPQSHTKSPNSKHVRVAALVFVAALYVVSVLVSSRTRPFDFFASTLPLPGESCSSTISGDSSSSATDISHIAFAIVGSPKIQKRRPFLNLWWRPNRTNGLLWLNQLPQDGLSWPPTLPSYRLFNESLPVPLQMTRVISETFATASAVANGADPRWLVIGDDDTVFFVDNLAAVLARYDHKGKYYVGGESESAFQNSRYFGMAFGGGGYALSAPLVKDLLLVLDGCLGRFQSMYILDQIMQSCIAEVGVSLTREPGFHQLDLRGNLSGFLSAHPQSPLVSFHHVDIVDPFFPSMTRDQSLARLMTAADADPSRLLQQAFCYDRALNRSFSLSFGYSVHVYEQLLPPRVLQVPIQTFRPWRRGTRPTFTFDVRPQSVDPCEAPHVFYFEAVRASSDEEDQIATSYARSAPRELPACGNHSAEGISRVRVISPAKRKKWVGSRRECCDVVGAPGGDEDPLLRVRPCREGEALY